LSTNSTTSPLRIAITADPELPVPPRLYGGIERIIDLLIRGLVARGHDVTLFANAESATAGRLVPWRGRASRARADTLRNAHTLAQYIAGGGFDLVHSFSRIAYLLPLLPLSIPKLMTYQRAISPRSVRLGHLLSRGSLEFCAVSQKMIEGEAGRHGRWHIVHNGVGTETYTFVPEVPADAPLVFLGRIEYVKGTHLAIDVARRSGARLVIAGNIPDEHRGYFERRVAPHIDGERVRYVGPVNDAQKNALLGGARAFLMPILWEEPFGIVLAEAMACGCPVIGLDRGAVAEVVEHGVTGFVVKDVEAMIAAVCRVGELDRRAARARVDAMFSDVAVVEAYLSVYSKLLARAAHSAPAE
jgi:glycosyltransferase involved in cell wall biosynthesis